MALGSLNLRVSKEDFVKRIELVEMRMNILQDVIERYGRAKENIDQFMESDDSNVDAMLERIDTKILSFSEKNPKRRRQVKIDFRKMFTSAFHFVKR